MFITFEGGEGAGKSTQIALARDYLESRGCKVLVTREPGGSEIAEKIREVLLYPFETQMEAHTEALLYAAARIQHVRETILPALEEGKVVLSDRYYDSSVAYQAFGRELGLDYVQQINREALSLCMPERTYFLFLSEEEGKKRIIKRAALDRIEQESSSFHARVSEGFRYLAGMSTDRILSVDASQSIEAISAVINRDLDRLLENR